MAGGGIPGRICRLDPVKEFTLAGAFLETPFVIASRHQFAGQIGQRTL